MSLVAGVRRSSTILRLSRYFAKPSCEKSLEIWLTSLVCGVNALR